LELLATGGSVRGGQLWRKNAVIVLLSSLTWMPGVLNKWPRKNGCELASFSRRLKAICNPQSAIRNQLEDNAFTLLRTADGRMAQFHTSWTQRKN
jgi:hypothetical protein